MAESFKRCERKLIDNEVEVRPMVLCTETEIQDIVKELHKSVEKKDYKIAISNKNRALFEKYVLDSRDAEQILLDLQETDFVGKIVDVGKGAKKRLEKGLPQEYLYVFQYPCELKRRDAEESGIEEERILIYIKINHRVVPYDQVFIISFHENE